MRNTRWLIGAVVLLTLIAFVLTTGQPALLGPDVAHGAFASRALGILILAAALCVARVLLGPTAADRLVAIDILGVLIVGACAVLAIAEDRSWFIDIGIAWALQSFIGALAFSKYLEGRAFDD